MPVFIAHTAFIHRTTPDCLKMSECDPYLAISLFEHLFPGIAKNVFPGLTIFKIFWFLLAGVLIAVNMHYAKSVYTLDTQVTNPG